MDDAAPPPRHLTGLTFHGPLSEARAARMVSRLARAVPGTVLDIGCGWGEMLLRILEAVPGARGVGVDTNGDDIARARTNAEARGLAERVAFAEEPAGAAPRGPADLVLCLGASHALSTARPPEHTREALRELRRMVAPGGRVLLGEGFWQRPPTAAELAAMWPDTRAEEFHDLAGLVDVAMAAGFRPGWIESATGDEWEEFESGHRWAVEEWLAAHPNHPLAGERRERADAQRGFWLRGHRGVLGLAYLTLLPVD